MFTTEEGTEDHCQVGSPLLSAQRTFDWLQEISAAHPPQHRISRQGRQPPPRAPADTSRGQPSKTTRSCRIEGVACTHSYALTGIITDG
jgi:hypothetical protein